MSNDYRLPLRRKTLVLASMVALGLAALDVAAAPQSGATDAIINASAVSNGESFSRFIVKYDKKSPPGLSIAASRANIHATGNSAGRGLTHVRRLAIGADLVEVAGGPVSGGEAMRIMNEFARDPNVESVEPESTRMISTSVIVCWRSPSSKRPICCPSLKARITMEQFIIFYRTIYPRCLAFQVKAHIHSLSGHSGFHKPDIDKKIQY